MSHDLINKIVPKTKVSGVVFDIRTGFEIVLSFYVKLMVQKEDGQFEEARGMYVKYTIKVKFSADFFQNSLRLNPTPGMFNV